jgi:hypothetical protein
VPEALGATRAIFAQALPPVGVITASPRPSAESSYADAAPRFGRNAATEAAEGPDAVYEVEALHANLTSRALGPG